MDLMLVHIKKHVDLSFSMLVGEIDACPDDIWNAKGGGFVFWQQLLHALTGILFWMRPEKISFQEPFSERRVYPELEKPPEGYISKDEMRSFGEKVGTQLESFFRGKDDGWLTEKCAVYPKILNIDVTAMQIRHIQYHVGHCNGILRDRNYRAVDWIDYLGE